MTIEEFIDGNIIIGRIIIKNQDEQLLLTSEGWYSDERELVSKYGNKTIDRIEIGSHSIHLFIQTY